MCSTPDVPAPTRYQESRAPTYRSGANTPSRSRGRRGTILSGMGGGGTMTGGLGGASTDTPVANKKTLLGS